MQFEEQTQECAAKHHTWPRDAYTARLSRLKARFAGDLVSNISKLTQQMPKRYFLLRRIADSARKFKLRYVILRAQLA